MRNRLQTANIFAFVVLGLFLFAGIVCSVIALVAPSFAEQTWAQNLITYAIGFGLPALIYGIYVQSKTEQRLSDTFSFHKLPLSAVLLLIPLGFLIQPLMSLVAALASLVFTDLTTGAIEQIVKLPLPLFILAIGVLPAFFEELVCRGMMLDGYRECPLWYQLVIPALFFGMLHMNFQQISYAFLAGIFFAYLVRMTGSIWSSIIVHFIVNSTQSLLLWLSMQPIAEESEFLKSLLAQEELSASETVLSALVSAAIALPLFLIVLYLLRRVIKNSREGAPAKPEAYTEFVKTAEAKFNEWVGETPDSAQADPQSSMQHAFQPGSMQDFQPKAFAEPQQGFQPQPDPLTGAQQRFQPGHFAVPQQGFQAGHYPYPSAVKQKNTWHKGGIIMYIVLGMLFLMALGIELLAPYLESFL